MFMMTSEPSTDSFWTGSIVLGSTARLKTISLSAANPAPASARKNTAASAASRFTHLLISNRLLKIIK